MPKFYQWLTPPTFNSNEQTRIARILHVILLTLLIGSASITVVIWFNNRPVTPWITLTGTIVTAVAIWLMRIGYLYQAGSLVLLAFLGILTLLAYKGYGIHDTALVAYPAMVVVASLLLTRRLFIIFLILLVLSIGFIAYSEFTGVINTDFNKQLVLSDAIVIVILVIITAISVRLLTDNLISSLAKAKQNECALAEINKQLQQQTEALRASEQRYSDLFEYATDAIFIESTTGDILGVNQKACELLGYTKEELLSLKVADIVPPRSPEETAKLRSNLKTKPLVFETKNIRKDGNWIDVEISIKKINLQGSQIAQVFVRDITERKEAEYKLKTYSERLEEMVAERTRDLEDAQERLIRQEKLAILGQLAGGIGHELRNPLGVISNAIYFLQMVLTDADATTTEYLTLINTRVQEAEKIVSDLLNLSRNRTADRTDVTVTELVDDALSRHPASDTVTIVQEFPSDLPVLFVDPQQIRQVLANLITNAYQAMPGGGQLTIAATARQDLVTLSITDTGTGMSPEIMAKVFEPLYTTKAKGIGLGLAISKNLAEANGGRINVQSIKGRGSTFTVSLPVSQGL